ncbi:hypothetical protein ACWD5F_01025 [Streptomyces sp. NPDC002499]
MREEALRGVGDGVVDGAGRPAVGRLLDACEPGLDPMDVIMLLSCLWRTPDNPEGAAQAERLMELAIDGFRP